VRTGWVAEDVHDLDRDRSFFAHVEDDGRLVSEQSGFEDANEAVAWALLGAERAFVRIGLAEITYVAVPDGPEGSTGDHESAPWPPDANVLAEVGKEVAAFKRARR
jgi:hypothetical protein